MLKEGLKALGASILELFLPRRCAGCERVWLHSPQGFWCEACLDELPWLQSPMCTQCGRHYSKSPSSPDHLCGDCLRSIFCFDRARSAVLHAGVVRTRIHQLKFGGQLHWVPPLTELLILLVGREADRPPTELILPVPLHTRRLRQRGFNQAGLLARTLGRRLGLPASFDCLLRTCWTEPQTRLNREQRLQNVKDAFQVADPMRVKGRRILLVDDVFTTGTTLNECAKTLKAAGAAEVQAVTVSRSVPDWKAEHAG